MDREGWKGAVHRLSPEEFRLLTEVVGEEFRAREAQSLFALRVGDWVEFLDRYGRPVRGTVQKMNRRTVEFHSEDGGGHHRPTHWKVSVSLVRRILTGEPTSAALPPRTLEGSVEPSEGSQE